MECKALNESDLTFDDGIVICHYRGVMVATKHLHIVMAHLNQLNRESKILMFNAIAIRMVLSKIQKNGVE